MAFERAPQPGIREPVFTGRNNGTAGLLKKGFFTDLPRSVKEQLGMVPALHREAVKEDEQTGLQREAAKEDESEIVQQSPVVEQPIARKEAPQAPPRFNHEAVVSFDARGKKTIEALPVGLDGVQRYRVTRDVRPEARTPPEVSREAAKEEEREEGSGVELPMQTKLRVSSPDDPAEREADEMADRVMTMPLQREVVGREAAKEEEREEVGREASDEELQAKCEDCEAEEKETLNREEVQREAAKSEEREEDAIAAKLQRKGDMSGATVDAGTAAQINSVRNSGGQPLAPGDRAFFEERMDADFSNVRVHTNAAANQTASAVQARAFTLGGDIVFNQGEYKPETSDGKRLLAHELTHTIQQGAAVSRSVRRKYQGAARSLLQRRGGRPRSQPAAATQNRGAPQSETESGAGFLVKKALDAAVWIIDQIPDAWFMPVAALGLVFKHGMRGFLQKLADSGGDRVLTVIANVARAVASFEFVKNYVAGFLKGFFVDGLWGTIEFLWEIIKLPYTLTRFAWNVVSSLGDVNIGAVLQSIANGASGAANWIGNNGRAILTEIKNKALSGDVGNLADTLQGMYRSVTGFVQRGGARLAEVMLDFFGQRSDRLGATLGNVSGTVAGNVTFEVAATALTAGGAQGLLRLRGPVGAALRWMAATGRRALDAAGDVYRTVRGLYTSLKSTVLAYLGRFSGMLRTKLDEMIEGVMRFFETLMARVRRGPRAADDAADAAGDGRRAAGAAEDARQPGGRPVPENRLDDFVQVGQYRMGFTPNGRLAICASPCQEARWLIDELRARYKGRGAEKTLENLNKELGIIEEVYRRGRNVDEAATSFTNRLKFTQRWLADRKPPAAWTGGQRRVESATKNYYKVADSENFGMVAIGRFEDGILKLDIKSRMGDLGSSAIHGERELESMLQHFRSKNGPNAIKQVTARWSGKSDNILVLNQYLKEHDYGLATLTQAQKGLILREAILATWTGQQLRRLGFTKIDLENIQFVASSSTKKFFESAEVIFLP